MVTSPYEDAVLAYIDILGWADLLRDPDNDENLGLVKETVRVVDFAASRVRARVAQYSQEGLKHAASTQISHFSDSIVLSCPADTQASGWMIWEAQLVCSHLLNRAGRYTRGAVVYGKLCHTDKQIYGPALVQAVEIERDVAKYPRLIVTEEASPFVFSWWSGDDGPIPQWSVDNDGLKFLEIIPIRIDHKRDSTDQIEARNAYQRVDVDLRKATKLNHQAKHGWMLRYLEGVKNAKTILTPQLPAPMPTSES